MTRRTAKREPSIGKRATRYLDSMHARGFAMTLVVDVESLEPVGISTVFPDRPDQNPRADLPDRELEYPGTSDGRRALADELKLRGHIVIAAPRRRNFRKGAAV